MSISQRSGFGFSAFSALWLFAGTAVAQGPASNPSGTDTSAKAKSFLERTLEIHASVRERLESTEGNDFSLTPSDAYLLSRIRLNLAFKPVSWLRFFGEVQDARVLFYRTTPGSGVSDPFDLRQSYVEAGVLEGNGVRLRVGRQDLQLGSGRLVATGDWGNYTKTFDIARGSIVTKRVKLDLLGGSALLADPNRMDRHRPGEHFFAAYSAFGALLPGASVEPYVMAKTQMNVKGKDAVLGPAHTIYAGGRVIGTTRGRFDYSFEGVREAGSYADDSIQAWGYVGGGGWRVTNSGWKPHLSSDYLYASGDSGKKDGTHQSFDFLYGLNQPLNSMTGLFSWRNIRDLRAGVDFAPSKKVKVKVDFRDYWLATVQDGVYNPSNVRTVFNQKATSAHVGEGLDATCIVALSPKTTAAFGVGNLFPGEYLKQSGKTTGFVYPSLSIGRVF